MAGILLGSDEFFPAEKDYELHLNGQTYRLIFSQKG
jgi:hypothetical protein